MRMRRKKYLDERLEACKPVCLGWIQDYKHEQLGTNETKMINARELFGNDNPLHIEIGCGKGRFIDELARLHPEINYIAVEQTANVIVGAMERTLKSPITNLYYAMGDAEYIEKLIPTGTVERIYLNFSCPYPKTSYAKHRLTADGFLRIYSRLLKRGGTILQKTDNMGLFEFSLVSFSQSGLFKLNKVTLDLHNSDVEGNIMTEYEERFTALGQPIYYLEAERI